MIRAALLLAVVLALPLAAHADVPVDEALHERAVEAYGAHRYEEAVELWREALAASPRWKYAYNAANTLYEDRRFAQAWELVLRAEELGVPATHRERQLELRARVSGGLLLTHAWIALTTDPPDAGVTLDGEPWAAPRERWTTATATRVRVSREGYAPKEQVWAHPPGQRHELQVRLEPLPREGRLRLAGAPAGAVVSVDGAPIGTLPLDGPVTLAAGPHRVVVTSAGFADASLPVEIAPGDQRDITVRLQPLGERPPDLVTPGWVLLGSGVATVAAGAGLLAWTADLTREMEDLNGSARSSGLGFDDYATRYDTLHERHDAARLAGAILTGTGAAAAATGIVLLVVDGLPAEPPVTAAPVDGGAVLRGTLRF